MDNHDANPLLGELVPTCREDEGVGTVDKNFTGDPDKKIFEKTDGNLPSVEKENEKEKEKLKIKYEKRKQIILKLKEFKMLNTIKKIVDFLLKYKNAVTNVVGFVFALAVFLKEYLVSNEPNVFNLITAVVVWVVAYFTGKSPLVK